MNINYRTLSFVMDIPVKDSKEIIKELVGSDKVTISDSVEHDKLIGRFGPIRSVDKRYDGTDKFLFYLNQRKDSYRNYLNEKSCIKNMRFTGKFALFYQMLTQEQIDFCHDVLSQKHKFIYGSEKNAANS